MGERRRAIRSVNRAKIFHAPDGFSAQALIELALVLPLLLVLVVGAIEFGRVFFTKIVITNSAREGAYYLSTHRTDASSCAYACALGTYNAAYDEALSSGITLNPADVTIGITADPEPDTDLYIGTVTVQTQVEDLLILGFFMGDAFHLSGSTGDFTVASSVEMMIQ